MAVDKFARDALVPLKNASAILAQAQQAAALVETSVAKIPGGPLSPTKWTRLPGIYRLLLSGSGTVSIDTRTASGTITNAADVYSEVSGSRYEYPYYDDAIEARATLTGSATAEII